MFRKRRRQNKSWLLLLLTFFGARALIKKYDLESKKVSLEAFFTLM